MKISKKLLSILLCAVMVLGSVAVGGESFVDVLDVFRVKASATQSRAYSGGFNTNYTYSSDPGQYVANIALAQKGKTGSNLGYSEAWCSNFIADCADLAGQKKLFLVTRMYQHFMTTSFQLAATR